jgi:hypothetical protein
LVLEGYDEELMSLATDPRRGMPADERWLKFPPNAGEVKRFCEAELERRTRYAKYAEMAPLSAARGLLAGPAGPKPAGQRANLIVPRDAPRFGEMCDLAAKADPANWKWVDRGIRVPLSWYAPSLGSLATPGAASPMSAGNVASPGLEQTLWPHGRPQGEPEQASS